MCACVYVRVRGACVHVRACICVRVRVLACFREHTHACICCVCVCVCVYTCNHVWNAVHGEIASYDQTCVCAKPNYLSRMYNTNLNISSSEHDRVQDLHESEQPG